MKPVADHALVGEVPRQGIELGRPGHVPVERRVEASHLREARVSLDRGLDRLDGLGHVIGRDRYQFSEGGDQLGGDPLGLAVVDTTVNHPMPHRVKVQLRAEASQARQHRPERGTVIRKVAPWSIKVAPRASVRRNRPPGTPIRSTSPERIRVSSRPASYKGHLQAGRAGVDRQNLPDGLVGHRR